MDEQPQAGTAEENLPFQVFIPRDYSRGTRPCFSEEFPDALAGKIDQAEFVKTIQHINNIFKQAEKPRFSLYALNFVSCLMGQALLLCVPNPYDKYFDELSAYVAERNRTLFHRHGLILINPLKRGLRVVEITEVEHSES